MPGAPYEGMGPLPPLPEYDPNAVRHYVIPEHWFDFLYERTGASGWYTKRVSQTFEIIYIE